MEGCCWSFRRISKKDYRIWCFLQSNNVTMELVNTVIKELISKWSCCKLINGRLHRPQSQGTVERSNQHVENIFKGWASDNSPTNLVCTMAKNALYHWIIRLIQIKCPIKHYWAQIFKRTYFLLIYPTRSWPQVLLMN